MDEGWHSRLRLTTCIFRVSLDGGVTWSIAKQLTASQTVVVQYNVDAVTAWNDLVKPAGMAYSVATGAYFRVRFTGGIYGDSAAIEAGIASQEMRVQFSATGVIGNPLTGTPSRKPATDTCVFSMSPAASSNHSPSTPAGWKSKLCSCRHWPRRGTRHSPPVIFFHAHFNRSGNDIHRRNQDRPRRYARARTVVAQRH